MYIKLNQSQTTCASVCQEVLFVDSSLRSSRGRDVVIINPYCEGGGDEALAKKIANIALDEGCRVVISPLDMRSDKTKEGKRECQSYSLQDKLPLYMSNLNSPLFIIAPVGIAIIKELKEHLIKICELFNFSRKDVIIIEEMDILIDPNRKLSDYEDMLKKNGFTNISINRLGFSEGAIGYIPTDKKTINDIKERFEEELVRLLDSYNTSFSSADIYHLGYISSDCYVTGTQVFVGNTLTETREDERDATFIISLRKLTKYTKPHLIDKLNHFFTTKYEDFDYPSLYAKITIVVLNSDTGRVGNRTEIIGNGIRKINIVLLDKLPKNIYEDFLLLAETGMASGDQSLSEYLTIKGTLPYYDMQPWKYPLVEEIKKSAGIELDEYVNNKIIGRKSANDEEITYSLITKPIYLTPEGLKKKIELDEKLSSHIASPHIRAIIRAKIRP